MKNLVRYISLLQETPTHSWRYEDWLNDLDDDSDDDSQDENDFITPEGSPREEDGDMQESTTARARTTSQAPRLPPRCPRSRSTRRAPPDIYTKLTPTHPDQVTLDAVQDLSRVFNEIHQAATPSRTSDRLAHKPKRDYWRLHNFGNPGEGEGSPGDTDERS